MRIGFWVRLPSFSCLVSSCIATTYPHQGKILLYLLDIKKEDSDIVLSSLEVVTTRIPNIIRFSSDGSYLGSRDILLLSLTIFQGISYVNDHQFSIFRLNQTRIIPDETTFGGLLKKPLIGIEIIHTEFDIVPSLVVPYSL